MKTLKYILLTLVLITFSTGSLLAETRQSRLSAGVSLLYESTKVTPFLQAPSVSYVQGYMRFSATLSDDVIIALDQEFYDGTSDPLYVSGGDWMAFVGVQRTGGLWVAAGNKSTMNGTPSNDRNWKIIDLKTYLRPDVWYKMRIEVDFSTRQYKNFTISGGGLNKTVDLSEFSLDFPNSVPFNKRAIGYFFSAVRSREMMKTVGTPLVYFDNIEGGIIELNGSQQKLFTNSFETQSQVTVQPSTANSIDLNRYTQSYWYLERSDSLVSVQQAKFALSGKNVGVANASLD